MSHTTKSVLIGIGCLVVGLMAGASLVVNRARVGPPGGGGIGGIGFGIPEAMIILAILLFIGFWVALIAGAVWGVGRLTRRGHALRMENLPADFDDWHRRAHERMRERGADDPDRRG